MLLKSGSWQPFWKLILWIKGYDVRGHVWDGLSEALTFNLSLEKLSWPTVLKERFFGFLFDYVGHHTWVSAKHYNRRNPQNMISQAERSWYMRDGTCHSVEERREKV